MSLVSYGSVGSKGMMLRRGIVQLLDGLAA
jgi:hypothetical protein